MPEKLFVIMKCGTVTSRRVSEDEMKNILSKGIILTCPTCNKEATVGMNRVFFSLKGAIGARDSLFEGKEVTCNGSN